MEKSQNTPKPYARVARPDELDFVCQVLFRAFLNDPIFNYTGSVKSAEANESDPKVRRSLKHFTKFLPSLCNVLGGRITVAVIPGEDGKETIGATSVWYPPNLRAAIWKIPSILRAGAIPTLRGWGWNGVKRLNLEFLDMSHKSFRKCFKARGLKDSTDNSWHLNIIGTDPDYQGKGLMSLLIREAYAHAPNDRFTLEASSPKSQAQYAHLGFETLTEIRLGKGKVSNVGFPASGGDAVGVPVAIMAKFPDSGDAKTPSAQS